MQELFTSGLLLSVGGGLVICSVIIQVIRNAVSGYLVAMPSKVQKLWTLAITIVVSALASYVWGQSNPVEDGMTYGMRFMIYLGMSSLAYNWVIKNFFPAFDIPATRAAALRGEGDK